MRKSEKKQKGAVTFIEKKIKNKKVKYHIKKIYVHIYTYINIQKVKLRVEGPNIYTFTYMYGKTY